MGGKWGQYTPEEQAFFKSARMHAYLMDPEYIQKKNELNRQRRYILHRDSPEFRERNRTRAIRYYNAHKAELKIKRQARNLLVLKNEIVAPVQIKIEKTLKKDAIKQEKEKKRAERQAIADAKALEAKRREREREEVRIVKIQEPAIIYPEVSHIVSFE